MRQGAMLVVTALDERTVVLGSRAGRYRLGAWSQGPERHPPVCAGSRLTVVLTRRGEGQRWSVPTPASAPPRSPR